MPGKNKQHKQDMMESYFTAMQARRERGENPPSEMIEEIYGRDPSERIDGGYVTEDDFRIHGMDASRFINTPLRSIRESLVNDYITSEDLNEYGYDNLGDFLNDENAFNMWYQEVFINLTPEKRDSLIKDVSFSEEKDQVTLSLLSLIND